MRTRAPTESVRVRVAGRSVAERNCSSATGSTSTTRLFAHALAECQELDDVTAGQITRLVLVDVIHEPQTPSAKASCLVR
jgi:hypothetical protein